MPVYSGVATTKTQLCDIVSRQLDKLKAKDVKESSKVSVSHHHHHSKKS